MGIQVDAVYEDGVLKPLQPLGLAEHEHISVTVSKAAPAPGSPQLDIAYLENLQANLLHAGRVAGLRASASRKNSFYGLICNDSVRERTIL
jgi:hypothetical protein